MISSQVGLSLTEDADGDWGFAPASVSISLVFFLSGLLHIAANAASIRGVMTTTEKK